MRRLAALKRQDKDALKSESLQCGACPHNWEIIPCDPSLPFLGRKIVDRCPQF